MPRGRGSKGGHKGQRRHFTNPDELEKQKEKRERERQWREQKGEVSSSEESDENKSTESEESEGEEEKAKGVQHLIEIENPNRVVKKPKKTSELGEAAEGPQLSRREREELQKQQARAHYMKLHAEGKTQQAQADLARLAIIKKQREEAARRRDEERKAREAAKNAKTEAVNKALGKKT